MNDPITAWALMVYLRDQGFYLWLGPSGMIYGGFAARVEKYTSFSGYFLHACADAETIQDAARLAAEQVCDLSGFEDWRTEWEKNALLTEGASDVR